MTDGAQNLRAKLPVPALEALSPMLRTRPYDDDMLFQVGFEVVESVDDQEPGARRSATFAKNFMEAIHLVRNQFGELRAGIVEVKAVLAREREKNGTIHDTYFFPTRRRETFVPDDLVSADG